MVLIISFHLRVWDWHAFVTHSLSLKLCLGDHSKALRDHFFLKSAEQKKQCKHYRDL